MDTAILSPPTGGIVQSQSTDIDITRLWRAHVSPADCRSREMTVFVEAGSSKAAVSKIAVLVAVLGHREPTEIEDRIYNVYRGQELIATGVSEDNGLRLFESGWSGNRVICWIESPLVFMVNPAPLLRAWCRIPRPATEVRP